MPRTFRPIRPGDLPVQHGLGQMYDLIVPTPTLSIRDKAIASWPPARRGQNLRDIQVSLGYDVDTPRRRCRSRIGAGSCQPKRRRQYRSIPADAGGDARSYREKDGAGFIGTFTGASLYVLHTFATT